MIGFSFFIRASIKLLMPRIYRDVNSYFGPRAGRSGRAWALVGEGRESARGGERGTEEVDKPAWSS